MFRYTLIDYIFGKCLQKFGGDPEDLERFVYKFQSYLLFNENNPFSEHLSAKSSPMFCSTCQRSCRALGLDGTTCLCSVACRALCFPCRTVCQCHRTCALHWFPIHRSLIHKVVWPSCALFHQRARDSPMRCIVHRIRKQAGKIY